MIKNPCYIHKGLPINTIVHYCGNHQLVFLCFDQRLLWRSFDNVLWSSSWHVFTKFPKTNSRFFSTKYYVIFVLIFSDSQNWEKCREYLSSKKFPFFSNWEILVKNFVDLYSQNLWKHIMNSIIVSEITLPFDTIRDALKVFPEWKIIYQVGNDALFDLPASQVKLKSFL